MKFATKYTVYVGLLFIFLMLLAVELANSTMSGGIATTLLAALGG